MPGGPWPSPSAPQGLAPTRPAVTSKRGRQYSCRQDRLPQIQLHGVRHCAGGVTREADLLTVCICNAVNTFCRHCVYFLAKAQDHVRIRLPSAASFLLAARNIILVLDPRKTAERRKVPQQGLSRCTVTQKCIKPKAPRDPAASTRPCLLCTSCTCSLSERAGRCSPLRNPCNGSFPDCARRCCPPHTPCTCFFSGYARRCSRLRNPCTRTFADCAHTCAPSRLVPPAYCCPLH